MDETDGSVPQPESAPRDGSGNDNIERILS